VPEPSGQQSADAADAPAAGVEKHPRPLVVFDGDCGFCVYWARYWQKLTGDRVEYKPYQEVAARYPEIPPAEFQRAVQYFAPDGSHARAAEAGFLTLSHAPGRRFWLALYRTLPGFAALSEWVYAIIAAHRPALYRLSLLLWGEPREPPRYELVSSLFLRLFGLIYLSGLAEVLVGVGVLIPGTRRIAAWATILLLIAILPANIHIALYNVPVFGAAEGAGIFNWIRIPFQGVLILWAWWYT